MPCYQVQLVSVKFKVKHESLLKQAAKELQWSYSFSGRYVNIGMVQIDMEMGVARAENQESINQLKRKYSEVALKTAAKKQNWKCFKSKTKRNTFVLQKF